MIKNFEEIHKQLQDLAPVMDSFKSEAVQLRIVELVFGSVSDQDDELPLNEPVDEQESSAPKKKARKWSRANNPINTSEHNHNTNYNYELLAPCAGELS